MELIQRIMTTPTEQDLRLFSRMSTSRINRLMDEYNGVKKTYRYLITFTLDPKKGPHNIEKIEEYIVKQFHRKPLGILHAEYVKEGNGQDKHIHWHAAVETSKPLKKDRFNYYIKLYGKLDISRTKAQNLEETLNYINKESQSIVIL